MYMDTRKKNLKNSPHIPYPISVIHYERRLQRTPMKYIDVEEQYDKIYRYCYFKVHHRETAEDIAQETFLRYLESGSYRNMGKALHYLYAIARNLCTDEYRRKKWGSLPEELPESGLGEGMGEGLEERVVTAVAVKAALEGLEETRRELILLRYVNEVPVAVISKLFGISRFAVYRRIREALEKLRESLKD